MREVIVQMATANKVQLNIELGNKMINELPFFQLDPEELGSESDDEGSGDSKSGDLHSAIARSIQQQEIDQEERESPMVAALRVLDQENRHDDMRKAAEAEMNI